MRVITPLAVVVLATACSHPIEIVGEENVLSASGSRDTVSEWVWLNVLYGIDVFNYSYYPNFQAHLNGIADAVMEAHDINYSARYH